MIRILLSSILGERRWTQADLARNTGIRPGTISDWYHEMTERVSLEHLDRICTSLGCDVSDILVRECRRKKDEGVSFTDRKRLTELRRVARHHKLGVARRRGGYMIFDFVTNHIVVGNEPAPYSLSLDGVAAYFNEARREEKV